MEWISGNIFIRPFKMAKAGDAMDGHYHNFDHTTLIVAGAFKCEATLEDGRVVERFFGEGQPHGRHCLIKARVRHRFIALFDNSEGMCVYSHRTPQGEVSLVNTGWDDAYV